MPITVIGNPNLATTPTVREAPIMLVEIKRYWIDGQWTPAPFLQFAGATVNSGREGPGTCTLIHHYGPAVKETHQAAFASVAPLDLTRYWVRVTLIAANTVPTVIWIGRITGETREMYADATQPAGRQIFTALEPLHLLERVFVSKAIWLEDGMAEEDALTVGFVPDMNGRDEWRMRVGNRSTDRVSGTYVYGGSNRWTREDYCNYVLEHFADEVDDASPGASTGPGWVMGGAVAVLREIADIVPMSDKMSVAEILRKMIDHRVGLDFKIVATDFSGTQGGFEVFVFAINAIEASFGGVSMPRNPQTLIYKTANARDFENMTIVRDSAQRYGRIRVLGGRPVCALSLRGKNAQGGNADTPNLVALWSAALETAYGAGSGTGDTTQDDEARKADKFAAVYQDFGAPDDWDHNGGIAAPTIDAKSGDLVMRDSTPASGVFGQLQRRKTLSFVPIAGDDGKYIEPNAWIFDEETEKHIACAAHGMAISALVDDWGIRVEMDPNHLLGLNHFTGDSNVEAKYDWEKMVTTIALEIDQRVELVYETGEIGGAEWKPSDGELVIEDDTAELWYLAPGTVKEVDQDGKLVAVEGDTPTVVRNDARQLYRWMAGAIGRYVNFRGRADLTLRGWHAYSHAVGAIFAMVEEKGDSHQIQAPVTSVEYGVSPDGGGLLTLIKAGYAR